MMSQKSKIVVCFLITAYLIIFPSLSPCAQVKQYTLGPQDVLGIEIWDNPDLSREVTVSLKGTISFPLIGEIEVEGLTSEQLQSIICYRLADGFLVNPQVTVTVKEYNSQKIYVLGEVSKPGYYPFSRVTTMVELISTAGGLTPEAGQEAYILRSPENSDQGRARNTPPPQRLANDLNTALETAGPLPENVAGCQVITINLNDFNQGINLNFELRNNDTLYIPKAKFFYAIGEVKSPGRFKLEKDVNVLQAISMAGGLTQKANVKKVTVIRNIKDQEQEISVEMTEPVLPDDIIKIPESFF